MKYHEIISALTEQPLLITPGAHASLLKLFEEHRALSVDAFKAKREGVDYCGGEVELDQMETVDGVAIIPIGGPIGFKLGKFEKGAGAVDSGDVMDEIDQAEEDPRVSSILLDIDSPGGMVQGTPELADRIAQCNKTVFAFTAGGMCSAAYWIACSADRIFATRSADIGCIGVYTPFLDSSKRYEQAGLRMDVISSGPYKGLGVPGTSLTPDHREFLGARVDEIAQMFYDHVQNSRPEVQMEDMLGQFYKGEMAMKKGMVDELVHSRDDVMDLLRVDG